MALYVKYTYNKEKHRWDVSMAKNTGVKLEKCPICGANAMICEWDGIGWVGCPAEVSSLAIPTKRHTSIIYSGKWNRRRSEAVKLWNEKVYQ